MVHSRRASLPLAGSAPCVWVGFAHFLAHFLAYFLALITVATLPVRRALAGSIGGDLSVTTDSIYRGISESNGHTAAQLDLHASTDSGTFVGVWSSMRDPNLEPGAYYDIEAYVGQRFVLGSSWNAAVTASDYFYVGGAQDSNNDFQQLTASLSYEDRWTTSISVIPNAVLYWNDNRNGRYAAYVIDTSGQWVLWGGFSLTGGAGYYYLPQQRPWFRGANGYAYGNAGVAYEYGPLRLDVSYFYTEHVAQRFFPYPIANRVAATLSWHF